MTLTCAYMYLFVYSFCVNIIVYNFVYKCMVFILTLYTVPNT